MGKNLVNDIPIIGPIVAGQQAADAAGAAQGAESDVLQQAVELAQQLAGTNFINPILQAGESGIRTFQSDAGGVPNIGLLASRLFGQNLQSAMQAAAGERGNNLRGAISSLSGVGNQYNTIAGQAGAAEAADNSAAQNQIGSLFGLPSLGTTSLFGTASTPANTVDVVGQGGGPVVQNGVYQPNGGFDPYNIDPGVLSISNTNTATGAGSTGQPMFGSLAPWLTPPEPGRQPLFGGT